MEWMRYFRQDSIEALCRVEGSGLLRRAWQMWRQLHGPLGLPSVDRIGPFSQLDFFSSAFCVEAIDGGRDFRFWHIGSALMPHLAQDYTGRPLSEVLGKRSGAEIWRGYRQTHRLGLGHFACFGGAGLAEGICCTEELFLPFRSAAGGKGISDIVVFVERRNCGRNHAAPRPGLPLTLIAPLEA